MGWGIDTLQRVYFRKKGQEKSKDVGGNGTEHSMLQLEETEESETRVGMEGLIFVEGSKAEV